uniref:Uncharacterized protein n=1 Tax=Timema tahoe TaxID=61484 RepID=A0A7R9FI16_9NEOP|nr:unnamed protein product [Timema tahoe]
MTPIAGTTPPQPLYGSSMVSYCRDGRAHRHRRYDVYPMSLFPPPHHTVLLRSLMFSPNTPYSSPPSECSAERISECIVVVLFLIMSDTLSSSSDEDIVVAAMLLEPEKNKERPQNISGGPGKRTSAPPCSLAQVRCSQHTPPGVLRINAPLLIFCRGLGTYTSVLASVVLTDSSQLTSDGFEKLPYQIMYPYAEPYDLKKNMSLAVVTSDSQNLVSKGLVEFTLIKSSSPGRLAGFVPRISSSRSSLALRSSVATNGVCSIIYIGEGVVEYDRAVSLDNLRRDFLGDTNNRCFTFCMVSSVILGHPPVCGSTKFPVFSSFFAKFEIVALLLPASEATWSKATLLIDQTADDREIGARVLVPTNTATALVDTQTEASVGYFGDEVKVLFYINYIEELSWYCLIPRLHPLDHCAVLYDGDVVVEEEGVGVIASDPTSVKDKGLALWFIMSWSREAEMPSNGSSPVAPLYMWAKIIFPSFATWR